MKFGEYTVLLHPITNFFVVYIFTGQSFSANQKIKRFITLLEQNKSLLYKFEEAEKSNREIGIKDVPFIKILINEIFKVIDEI